MVYQRRPLLILTLIVTTLLALILSPACAGVKETAEEVKIESLILKGGPSSLEGGIRYAEVVVLPNKHTVPGAIYDIELVAVGDGQRLFSYGKKPVKWTELPPSWYAGIKLKWTNISPNDPILRAIAEEATKPVAQRRNIKLEDFLRVEWTRR
ncbi:MAG TPA: hypothetical protein VMV84_05870 [Dehalococcoidales bacterium]|nr:hypothetical protein [Dehalococcoidales bacterium]